MEDLLCKKQLEINIVKIVVFYKKGNKKLCLKVNRIYCKKI